MTYTKKTTDQIKAAILLNIVQNTDEITDINVGSIIDLFVTAFSQEQGEQYDDLDEVYNASRINTATGDDLEEIGSIVGVNRNQGVKATGTVTFSRNTPASVDFVILKDSVVSTQPNTETSTISYVVDEDTTFSATITDESHTFKNGIYQYKLDQRFIDSVTEITGTVSSSPNTFVQNTDYSVTEDFDGELIVLDNFVLVNDCETVGDFTEGDEADAPTANTSEYYEGTQSINMLKSGTTDTELSYTATLGSVKDITNRELFTNVYIKDAPALAKIVSIDIYAGSGGSTTNSYQSQTLVANLAVGWNRIKIDPTLATTTTNGTPDDGNINFIKILVTTSATSDTFSAGDLMMDFWYLADSIEYVGDIIQWDKDATIPDTDAAYLVDYVPLSVEVNATAQNVGTSGNVSEGKIIFMVTSIPSINRVYNYDNFSNGVNVETDVDYRTRIKNASNIASVATVAAIKSNIEELSFVASVSTNDLPLKSVTNEVKTYYTGTDTYTLDQKVAVDDANLTIGDTPGASDYVRDTDFALNTENQIDWSIGGSNPSNAAQFYIDYDYNKLGFIEVTVIGTSGTLTTSQLTTVQETADSVKSAGITVTVLQPTYVTVAVAATVTVASGFTASTVQSNCETAIEAYINSLGLGDDVLIAGVIDACYGAVEGVANISVTDIGGGGASDYSISSSQVATPGTITIT